MNPVFSWGFKLRWLWFYRSKGFSRTLTHENGEDKLYLIQGAVILQFRVGGIALRTDKQKKCSWIVFV